MKIYTKTGDNGHTGLLGQGRVLKDHPRIEAYGTVDELNAMLGLARSSGLPAELDHVIRRVQNELFCLGTMLSAAEPDAVPEPSITAEHVQALERDINRLERSLPPLTQFILPGGTPGAATLHAARTVCRRAERRVVGLRGMADQTVPEVLIRYLNRLGDLLFVAARAANHECGVPDETWKKDPFPVTRSPDTL